ncbi:DUF4399 domain-containing protein [Polaromonas sp. P1(28)-8]|nr:DUF4399 domain-containing protein [Polaromonas sp. P1(28)-8]
MSKRHQPAQHGAGCAAEVAFQGAISGFRAQRRSSEPKEKDTGHFRLTLTPQGGLKPAEMNFANGQSEVWLAPPSGAYTLKLDFMDNVNPGKTLVEPVSVPVRVE